MRLFRKLLLWAVFLLYIAVLLRITVFRSDFGTHPLFREGRILWVPFVSLYRILRNSTGWFLYYLVGNLIWFIPAGLLLPALTHCGPRAVLWGAGLSLLIEISQYVFGTGVTEVEDLILNTLGAAIGYGVFRLIRRMGSAET